jgi:3-oxoacyl-[acyl-carrier-protein] synthase-1
MNGALAVQGSGAVTSVGLTAAQTCAAMRASITGFADSSFFQSLPAPVPLVAARVPLGPPPENDHMIERLVRMAAYALQECLDASAVNPDRMAMLIAVRESFRRHPDLDGNESLLLEEIQRALRLRFHEESRVVPSGNAAVFHGLLQARILLQSGTVEACIVGGVDSYLNPYDLRRFQDSYRLKCEGVPQGFIPGEAAAFVTVTDGSVIGSPTGNVAILGVGIANEDPAVTILSDGHPTGRGLRNALHATLQDAQRSESEVAFRVSDLNGEYYRGVESVLCQSRFYRSQRERLEIWLPAAYGGETGAAVGALLVILSAVAMRKGYAPGPVAMCEASSDTGLRAGCLVARMPVRGA